MIISNPLYTMIKDKETLKKIFSNIEIIHSLKLIKYNKKIQNNLGVTKDLFKNYSNLPQFEFKNEFRMRNAFNRYKNFIINKSEFYFIIFWYSIIFLYTFIYAILLNSLDTFTETNIKTYNEPIIRDINKLNKWLIGLIFLILISLLLIIFFVIKETKNDEICKKALKRTLMIFFTLVHFIYEIIVLIKFFYEKGIKKVEEIEETWFMGMDVAFLIFNGINTIFLLIETIRFEVRKIYKIEHFFGIQSVNNIKIEEFTVNYSFTYYDEKEKKEYISKNIYFMKSVPDNNEKDIILLANKKRVELGLDILNNFKMQILGFMGILPLEAYFENKTIFQLSHDIYLIWCTYDEFCKKINNDDKTIINTLKNDRLNSIKIINKNDDNKSYIYIWDSSRSYSFKNYFENNNEKDIINNNIKNNIQENKDFSDMENSLETNLLINH